MLQKRTTRRRRDDRIKIAPGIYHDDVNWYGLVHGRAARSRVRTVAKVRAKWHAAGLAPKTINNRVNTLRHLYRSLDGKRAWTPCEDLTPMEVHKTPIRFVTDAVILAVDLKLQELERDRKLRQTKARARFRVVTSTGRRPSEIMRTEPGDLDLERRVWLPRDGKGGFSPGRLPHRRHAGRVGAVHCTPPAGRCCTSPRRWPHMRLAGWPADVRPYNARHTVGITLSESGADLDERRRHARPQTAADDPQALRPGPQLADAKNVRAPGRAVQGLANGANRRAIRIGKR